MKRRIVASVINNIAFDQRVQKTLNTLFENGYGVVLIGTELRGKPEVKRSYPIFRMPLGFQKSWLLYAEFNLKLLYHLLMKTRKNDLLWANDLDSLLPNYVVSRLKNLPLIFDSHELFSELPSVQGRASQKVWRFLEKRLISKPDRVITVSDSIADWFQNQYGIDRPQVIKNLPHQKDGKTHVNKSDYILYQGVLNKGRGLLELIQSMHFLPDEIQLKIAGDGPIFKELNTKISDLKLENRVQLLGQIPPHELKDLTENAMLGVSLEQDMGLSYRYSLPNKLFDYIQAKIPVVSTYLPEIQKIVTEYEIGEVIESHRAEDIAKAIKKVWDNDSLNYQNGLQKAAEELTWEKQTKNLLSIVHSVQSANEIS